MTKDGQQEPCTQHKQFGRTFCSDCVNELVKDAQLAAAEQLAEVRAANRELIRQHEEDKRRADVRAKAIRQTKQQLADKEREINTLNKNVTDLVGCCNTHRANLAAQSAVVEIARNYVRDALSRPTDWRISEPTAWQIACSLDDAIKRYDELQGGE